MVMPAVSVQNFSLTRGNFRLKNISLEIGCRETYAIIGPTGAGKTLLLEAIAGFYQGCGGRVLIDGLPVAETPAEKRRIGFVYQDQGLFPHLTVFRNIGYGLRMRRIPKDEIDARVLRMAELFSISHLLDRYPATLSGGEKQRVALARTMILEPGLLLLDEPFSALDPATKEQMYRELDRVHQVFGCTILFVTHDFSEAMRLADRIGVILNGELRLVSHPDDLLKDSYSPQINAFLGIQGSDDNDRESAVSIIA